MRFAGSPAGRLETRLRLAPSHSFGSGRTVVTVKAYSLYKGGWRLVETLEENLELTTAPKPPDYGYKVQKDNIYIDPHVPQPENVPIIPEPPVAIVRATLMPVRSVDSWYYVAVDTGNSGSRYGATAAIGSGWVYEDFRIVDGQAQHILWLKTAPGTWTDVGTVPIEPFTTQTLIMIKIKD
ncbi:MAG: hypothetical protein AB1476_03785 [Candidatus Hadarchaeota archaeon]